MSFPFSSFGLLAVPLLGFFTAGVIVGVEVGTEDDIGVAEGIVLFPLFEELFFVIEVFAFGFLSKAFVGSRGGGVSSVEAAFVSVFKLGTRGCVL